MILCLYIIISHFEKYYQNEDSSTIHVHKISGVSNTFPSITFCFQPGKLTKFKEGLYNKSKIQTHLNISVAEYHDILLGKLESKDIENI